MDKFILLDEKQANKAFELIKNDLNKRPSVKTEDSSIIKEEDETVITEGLKFFKASEKLYKLSDKIIKKSQKQNLTDEEVRTLTSTSKKIRILAKKFEEAEDLYSIGRKQQARIMEKELKKSYIDILKILKKSNAIDTFKKAGAFAMLLSGMVLPYVLLNKFFPALSFGATNAAAATEKNIFKQIGLYFKRAGAFALCRIPTNTADKIINNKIDKEDEKIVKTLDKKLK